MEMEHQLTLQQRESIVVLAGNILNETEGGFLSMDSRQFLQSLINSYQLKLSHWELYDLCKDGDAVNYAFKVLKTIPEHIRKVAITAFVMADTIGESNFYSRSELDKTLEAMNANKTEVNDAISEFQNFTDNENLRHKKGNDSNKKLQEIVVVYTAFVLFCRTEEGVRDINKYGVLKDSNMLDALYHIDNEVGNPFHGSISEIKEFAKKVDEELIYETVETMDTKYLEHIMFVLEYIKVRYTQSDILKLTKLLLTSCLGRLGKLPSEVQFSTEEKEFMLGLISTFHNGQFSN